MTRPVLPERLSKAAKPLGGSHAWPLRRSAYVIFSSRHGNELRGGNAREKSSDARDKFTE